MATDNIEQVIKSQLSKTLNETNFPIGTLYRGKVRDNYIKDNIRIIIATDRISSFDRVITTIPFKGEILNRISTFWFEKTRNLVKNHVIKVPDPNVTVVHQCQVIPVEFIVRAYITGTMWRNYSKGEMTSGIKLSNGLKKNQKLDHVIITPSTKAESGHDIYLTKEQIIKEKMVDKEIYEQMEDAALKLFNFGQNYCKKNGLIMVDTKYEFGMKGDELLVVDEIHTQDSSRFWILDSYEEKFSIGEEPDILDKEVFRGWLVETYPEIFPNISQEQEIPPVSEEIKIEVTKRYIKSFEKITGIKFKAEVSDVYKRIETNLKKINYL